MDMYQGLNLFNQGTNNLGDIITALIQKKQAQDYLQPTSVTVGGKQANVTTDLLNRSLNPTVQTSQAQDYSLPTFARNTAQSAINPLINPPTKVPFASQQNQQDVTQQTQQQSQNTPTTYSDMPEQTQTYNPMFDMNKINQAVSSTNPFIQQWGQQTLRMHEDANMRGLQYDKNGNLQKIPPAPDNSSPLDSITGEMKAYVQGARTILGDNASDADIWKKAQSDYMSAKTQLKQTQPKKVITTQDSQGNWTAAIIDPTGQTQPQITQLGKYGKDSPLFKDVKDADGNVVARIDMRNPNSPPITPDQYGLTSFSSAPLTASVKTMKETAPQVEDLINKVENQIKQLGDELGPVAGRWSDFVNNGIGAGDPKYSALYTNMNLMKTLLAKMHVGTRPSEYMMQEFTKMTNLQNQTPQNLISSLEAIKNYAQQTAQMGNSSPLKKPSLF